MLPQNKRLAQGEVSGWNPARDELLQEDESGQASQSWKEEFGDNPEELPAGIYFFHFFFHGLVFH